MHTGEAMPLARSARACRRRSPRCRPRASAASASSTRTAHLAGIITDGDLRRHMSANLLDARGRGGDDAKAETVRPDQLVSEALELLNSTKNTRCSWSKAASRSASCICTTSCARAWRKSGLVSRARQSESGGRALRSRVPGECSERLARAERDPGPSARIVKRNMIRVAIRRAAPGSRVSLRSPGTRERGPRACAPISCPGRAERAHARERSESRDPAQSAAKRKIGRDPSCGPWVRGLAALARDTRCAHGVSRCRTVSPPVQPSQLSPHSTVLTAQSSSTALPAHSPPVPAARSRVRVVNVQVSDRSLVASPPALTLRRA